MKRIAKFEKVSFEQFKDGWNDTFEKTEYNRKEEQLREIYDNIKLPMRATAGSAGYDFFVPADVVLIRERRLKFLQEFGFGWKRNGF